VPPDSPTACLKQLLLIAGIAILAVVGALPLRGQIGSDPGSATSVSGQVVNAVTGMPIPRALVRLNERAMLTDHEGKFLFDQYTGSGSNLEVTKPGFYASIDPSEGQGIFLQSTQLNSPIKVQLYPEALLTGTVTAPDGEPLPHIPVTARRSIFDEIGRRSIPADQGQTDSHGNFRLPVPQGDYRLETNYTPRPNNSSQAVLPVSIPADSKSNTSNKIHVRSGEEQHFDLHPAISRAYTVTMRIEAGLGRGFPGFTARSSTGNMIPVGFQPGPSQGEGKLQLPSGTYTLTATMFTSDGGVRGETTVTVPDHDVSGVVVRLAPNPSIPVELLVDSNSTSDKSPPLAQQLGLTLQSAQFDPDRDSGMVVGIGIRNSVPTFNVMPGIYRLQARNAGQWYVKSASYGGSDLLQQELTATSGASGTPIRVTVSNQTGELQGAVSLNGTPAACWIYLIPTAPGAMPFIAQRSNSNGTYNIPYLPPGTYQAIAFEHRHSTDYRDPETLAAFMTSVRSVTVNPGEKSTLNLEAVDAAESVQ